MAGLQTSLSARLTAGIALIVLLMLGIIAYGLVLSSGLATSARSNAASYRVLDNVDRAYGAIIDLANRSRAYVLSDRDPRRVKGYEDAKAFYLESMTAARKELAATQVPVEISRALDAMDTASQRWRSDVGDPIIKLGSDAATAKQALELAGSTKAADIMQDYRTVVANARDVIARWSQASQAEQDQHMASLIYGLYGSAALLIGLAVFLGWRLRNDLVAPVIDMTKAMNILASGDLAAEIPHVTRRDEIGRMASALQVFKDSAAERERIRFEADQSRDALDEARSSMDLERQRTDRKRTDDLSRMVEQVEAETRDAVDLVVNLMDGMTEITGQMSHTARALGTNSEAVAAAANESQETMENARSATARLAASIDMIAERVRSTHIVTQDAVSASQSTQQTIHALSNVVAEIDGVAKMIMDIARQTNLLAINAGVEAARSGQDGRGFAVIAHEVKNLSEQTSSATGRISDLVHQIRNSTSQAVQSVEAIATSIDSVSQAASDMASSITEQVATTHEISAGITETASMNGEVTTRIHEIAEEASATGMQATEVDRMCADVASHVRHLQSTLVRIVRTSSAEADRRRSERIAVEQSIDVECGHRRTREVMSNISVGGALISGRFDRNARLMLRLPQFASPLRAQVAEPMGDCVRVQFDVEPQVRQALEEHIKQLAQGQGRRAA